MKSKKIKKLPKPLAKAKELFHLALAQSPSDRESFLERYSGVNSIIKEQVRELLAAHEENSNFPKLPISLPSSLAPDHASLFSILDLSLSPTLIGPYLLLQRIDSGGMAEVYLARKKGAKGFEKEVALKCVLPKHVGDNRIHQWFEEEAKLGARLNHPNIVQIHDFTLLNEGYWLVMEYILGKNLGKVLQKLKEKDRRFSPGLAAYIACELFKALEYAHQRVDERTGRAAAVIHRDISPKNIILSFLGDLKVVDYGIAKVAADPKSGETQTGMVKGTPAFMSPEQSRGELLDAKTDIYSAALVLYELLATRPLWRNEPGAGMNSLREYSGRNSTKYQLRVRKAIEGLPIPLRLKECLGQALAWLPSDRPTAETCRLVIEETYRAEISFSQQALREELSSLFEKEIAEEKALAVERERKIEIWRERGLLNPEAFLKDSEKNVAIDLNSWKRSPLIIGLMSLTILTTAFNAFVQLVPDNGSISRYFFSRSLATIGICSLNIHSNPSSARVTANSVVVGQTPLLVRVQCGKKVKLELEHEGYRLRQLETKASEIERNLYFDLAQ